MEKNPQKEAIEAAQYIPDARYVQVPSLQGHFTASPAKAADVKLMNKTVHEFLDIVTDHGKRLQ